MNDDALKLENQLCFPLYVAAKDLVGRYKPLLDRLDLTYTQYIAMLVLWQEKSLTVKDLGDALHLDSGTLTPLLKRLEAKGYLERRRSLADERVVNITITPTGVDLKQEALEIPERIASCVPLEHEDLQTLYRLLYKLIGVMDCAD